MIQDELPFEDAFARKHMERKALHRELVALIHPDWDSYIDNSKFRDAVIAAYELTTTNSGFDDADEFESGWQYAMDCVAKTIYKELR